MKRLISLFGGMVFLLAFGIAYAAHSDDTMGGKNEANPKMINDQDLQKYDHDGDQGTVSQMQARPFEGGSAAGGSGETVVQDDTSEKAVIPTEEKVTQAAEDSGRGTDSSSYQGAYSGMSQGMPTRSSNGNLNSGISPRMLRRY